MVGEAVEIERSFITEALPVGLIGMNAKLMERYTEFVADRLRRAARRHPWHRQPVRLDGSISMQGKTNFFERRVGEHQRRA